MKKLKIIFAAGGTGGHIIPALTLAQDWQNQADCFFLCSSKEIDKKLLKDIPHCCLPLVSSKFKSKWLQAAKMVISVFEREKPDFVLGLGGFVSFFPIIGSKFLGIKNGIFELELNLSYLHNFLSFFANVVFTSNHLGLKKEVYVGYPVRKGFFGEKKVKEGFTVSVFGGSQGAEFLDLEVSKALASCSFVKRIYHQARSENLRAVEIIYHNSQKEFLVSNFFDKPWEFLLKSDCVIARAGAGSVHELLVSQIPFVLFPYKLAARDHQKANAEWLVKTTNMGIWLDQDDALWRLKLFDFLHSVLNSQVRGNPTAEELKSLYYKTPELILEEIKNRVQA